MRNVYWDASTIHELIRKRERARVIKLRLVAATLFMDLIVLTDYILRLVA